MKVKLYEKNGSLLIMDEVKDLHLKKVSKRFLVDDIDEIDLNDIKKIIVDDEVVYESGE